jgi:HEPN domain-containing protein
MLEESSRFEAWGTKAEEDFTSARILLDNAGQAAAICFLCRQVAEKYLKGYRAHRGQPLKKIHQLDVLVGWCIGLDDSFRALVDDAVVLKGY